jgi:antitoxin component YwqK of YwqJK toxin-antitoxin module
VNAQRVKIVYQNNFLVYKMTSNQCKAITAAGTQCTRAAVTDGYCKQHYKIENKIDIPLLKDITSRIVSDYIDFDELINLENSVSNLKINEDRVNINEYDKIDAIDYTGVTVNRNVHIIEIIIDNVVRNRKKYYEDIKIGEENYDEKGLKSGKFDFYYDSGKIQYEINYKKDLQNGLFTSWYLGGIKKSEINYKDGKVDGISIEWHSNAVKNMKVTTKMG